MSKIKTLIIAAAMVPMMAMGALAAELSDHEMILSVACEDPGPAATEIMQDRADKFCAQVTQSIEDGTFRMTKSTCTAGIASTFARDSTGASCPDTWLDKVGEFIAVGLVSAVMMQAAGADIPGIVKGL